MSKFKIGDHVRVTAYGLWFDKVGEVVDVTTHPYCPFVTFGGLIPPMFADHELILADPEREHTGKRVDTAEHDPVNHPSHYTSHPSGVECITITRHMSFPLGNALKYIWRADLKNGVEDLKKARFYIDDEIQKREASE